MELDDPTANTEVLLTERTGHVLVLTLNRPRSRNALNPELKDAILQATAEADQDPDVRAVVITGNGPVFCAGMDLKAFAGGAAFGGLTDFCQDGIGKPLIAALNGPALGGGTTVATRIPPAVALAEKLAANGPLAVALTKKLIRERRPPAWTGK